MTTVEQGGTARQAVVNNAELLRMLERWHEAEGPGFSIHACIPSVEHHATYVRRAAELLNAPRWEQRNLGVKLLGLLQSREHAAALARMVVDRTPAGLLARLLGGDFRQVGFIRRNALTALARLGVVTDEVERALVVALADPYYEARAEAARTAAALAGGLCTRRQEVLDALERCAHDRSIEVAAAAAEAIGDVGDGERSVEALTRLAEARFWKVRAGALAGLLRLVQRRQCADLAAVEAAVRRFVLTSTDFQPQFQIKHTFGMLLAAIGAEKGPAR